MTTVSSIINDAFRETNLISLGKSPTDAEKAEGLTRLQNIVSSVLGYEAGENLSPLSLELNCYDYVPSNSRVMLSQTAAQEIKLDPQPNDGARFGIVDVGNNLATYNLTVDGNGRTIEDASSVVINENGITREWFYRADLGDWVRVTDLTEDGDMPFPKEFDDMFITMLAMRLNPRFGQTLDQASISSMRRSQSQFRARYWQRTEMPAESALLRLRRDWTRVYDRDYFSTGR